MTKIEMTENIMRYSIFKNYKYIVVRERDANDTFHFSYKYTAITGFTNFLEAWLYVKTHKQPYKIINNF